MTPMLRQLYWLPVRQRITLRLAMITFKCLYGLAPIYLADLSIPVSSVVGRWQLRSADNGTLIVPARLRGVWFGDAKHPPRRTTNFVAVDRLVHAIVQDPRWTPIK